MNSAMRYRKKPVVIEAIQFLGTIESVGDVCRFAGQTFASPELRQGEDIHSLTIPTLEGDHTAMPGDFIIRGVKGEYYPCKPDIFEATYDLVTDPAPHDIPRTSDDVKAIESQYPRVPIFVNGGRYLAPPDRRVTYEKVVALADTEGTPSVRFAIPNQRNGILLPGNFILVEEGTTFDVHHTGNG